MTENNPQSRGGEFHRENNDPPQPVPPPPGKKRRRWLKIIGILLILVILLIVFAPAILSTAPMRNFVVGRINDGLNGRLVIGDWSLGWTGGITIEGVKVFDDRERLILEMRRFQTPLSLIDAAGGDLNLGETTIEGLNLVQLEINEDGSNNYQKLMKETPSGQRKTETSGELPNLSGKITITSLRGTIIKSGMAGPLFIDEPSSVMVNIEDLNRPISNEIKLVYRVGNGPAGTLMAAGKVDFAENGIVQADKLSAEQKIQLIDVDLAAAGPLAAMAEADLELTGTANGGLDMKFDGLNQLAADGNIEIQNFSYSGQGLQPGETFSSGKVEIPIQITQTAGENGAAFINIEKLALVMDQGAIDITANTSLDALQNLAKNLPPGNNGQLKLVVNIEKLGELANAMPRTLGMIEGVQFQSGTLHQTIDLQLSKNSATLNAQGELTELAARDTEKNRDLRIDPITFNLSASSLGGGGVIPDLRNIAVGFQSDFATIQGGGESLAGLNITGNLNLQKLREQAGQFTTALNHIESGIGKFMLETNGDISKTDSQIATAVNLTFTDLHIIDPQAPSDQNNSLLREPWLALRIKAKLLRGEQDFIRDVRDLSMTLKTRNEQNPTIDLAAAIDLKEMKTVSSFTLERLNINLPAAQEEFAALIPFMDENGLKATNGRIALQGPMVGSFDGKVFSIHPDKPLALAVQNLSLQSRDEQNRTVDLIRDETLTLTLHAGAPADLTTLNAEMDVNSDFLTASVKELRLLLQARQGNDTKPAGVWEMVQNATVTATVNDLPRAHRLYLAISPAPEEKAVVPMSKPNQPISGGDRISYNPGQAPVISDATANAQPLPPLEVQSGSMRTALRISRENQTTRVDVSEFRIEDLSLRRGDHSFQWDKPIDVKLAAAIDAAGDPSGQKSLAQQIDQFSLASLTAQFGIAEAALIEPIIIKDLAGTPLLNGKLRLAGQINQVSRLMEVLTGDELPYQGDFVLTEQFATDANHRITIAGQGQITQFQAGTGSETISERQIDLSNDLVLDYEKKIAQITNLKLDMKNSGALSLAMSGNISQWDTHREFGNFIANIDYDLAKLWPIIKPLLGSEQQENLRDLQIAGKFQRKFTLGGSFPAEKDGRPLEFYESIRSLTASGSLALEKLDWKGSTVQNFDYPLFLKDGNLMIARADRPADYNLPPADFNGGKLDLGGITLELGRQNPRLTIPPGKKLLAGVAMNPIMSDTLFGKLAPLFTNPKEASGLLDLTVVQCDRLPLSELITLPIAQNNGRAEFLLSVADLNIVNGLLGELLRLVDAKALQGNITDGRIVLEKGRVQNDISLLLGSHSQTIRFQGGIGLQEQRFLDYAIGLSPELLRAGKDFRKYLPEGISLPLSGSLENPQLDPGNLIGQLIKEAAARALLERALPQPRDNRRDESDKSPTSQPTQPDPLGGLLDILEDQLNKDRESKEN